MSPSSRVTEGFVVLPDHHSNSSSSDSEDEKKEGGGGGGGVEEEGERGVLGRVRGVLRKEEIQSQFEELRKRRAHGQGGAVWNVRKTYRLREREREKGGCYNYFIL